ncbi:MAG: hypothetical protein ACOCWC_05645, partial [Bacteroidota bacterium]
MIIKKLIGILILLYITPALLANNVQITSEPILKDVNPTEETFMVNFSVSWENSWRNDISGTGYAAPYNYDAIWVFMKYKIDGGNWQHATLSSTGHIIPLTATYSIPSDNKGVFIYRAENGLGNIVLDDIELKWDYGFDGVVDVNNIEFKVFAIEMVYVPEGAFYVGDG